jgi:hypothetical protein
MRNLKIVSSSVFFFWVLLTLTGCKKETPEDTTPFIVTSKTVEVYSTFTNVGGNVTSDGGAPITEKGICYSTSSNPDINSTVVLSNSQLGGFEVDLVNLNPQTNYFARAFAKNKNGVSYGNTVSFTTTGEVQILNELFDEPCNAGILENLFSTYTINNFNATPSSGSIGNPSCGGSVFKDFWLKFQAPIGGDITITTTAGTITDAALAIYSENSDCNNLIQIGCVDDVSATGSTMPSIILSANVGQIYYIRLWDYDGDNGGQFNINFTF